MLEKFEKKFGKYAIKNLIYYILGAYVIGYVLLLAKPEWYEYIVLYPSLVMRGQVWRLFTWVCTVPQALSILTIFMFLFYFYIGKSLEQSLGAFKYNLYIFSGWFFTTLGVMAFYWITEAINGPGGGISIQASTNYMNLTSFLATAVLFPDVRVLFFGILPVRMKILAWIDGIYLGLQALSGLIIAVAPQETVRQALEVYYGTGVTNLEVAVMRTSGISILVTILISMLNFLIFLFVIARKNFKNRKRYQAFNRKADEGRRQYSQGYREGSGSAGWQARGSAGQNDSAGSASSAGGSAGDDTRKRYRADSGTSMVHRCDICGRTNIDHPELMFRYCSKCAGSHEYCQDHLFTHEHVK